MLAGVEVGVRKLPGAEALSRSLTGERTQRGHGDARPGEWPRARMHAERTAPLSAESTEADETDTDSKELAGGVGRASTSTFNSPPRR